MLDWKNILVTVIAAIVVSYGGWLTLSALATEKIEIRVKTLEDSKQDTAAELKKLQDQIEDLRKTSASKDDIKDLKRLTEKLLELQLRRAEGK